MNYFDKIMKQSGHTGCRPRMSKAVALSTSRPTSLTRFGWIFPLRRNLKLFGIFCKFLKHLEKFWTCFDKCFVLLVNFFFKWPNIDEIICAIWSHCDQCLSFRKNWNLNFDFDIRIGNRTLLKTFKLERPEKGRTKLAWKIFFFKKTIENSSNQW